MRKPFVDLAKKKGVSIRGVYLEVDEKVAFMRNRERFQRGDAPMVRFVLFLVDRVFEIRRFY